MSLAVQVAFEPKN